MVKKRLAIVDLGEDVLHAVVVSKRKSSLAVPSAPARCPGIAVQHEARAQVRLGGGKSFRVFFGTAQGALVRSNTL